MKRLSTIAWLISALSITVAISPGRSNGMVVTTTPPAFKHAEPGGEQGVAVGPAQQHAIAGDQALLLDQQPGDAAGEVVELAIGPAAVGVDDGEVVGLAALQQFGRGVEALGIIEQAGIRAAGRPAAAGRGRRS